MASRKKRIEQFLTDEARRGVAVSTQSQALNALIFFYKAVLKAQVGAIEAGRSRRPEHVRKALTIEEQGTRNKGHRNKGQTAVGPSFSVPRSPKSDA